MTEHNEVAPVRKPGMLSNPRHEAFCHAIARGASIEAGYVEAGFKANRGNASRLNSYEGVKARVAELRLLVGNLQKLSLTKTVLTQSFVLENLMGIVADARALNDFAGANKALHLLGLELGLFCVRAEVGAPGAFDGLSIADKRERIMDVARQLGLGGVAPGERMIGVSRAKLLQLINDGKGE
jgi:hypothetical protein